MIFDIQLFSSSSSPTRSYIYLGKLSILPVFPALVLCCEQHSLLVYKSLLHLWQRVSVLVHFCVCLISLFLLHLACRSYHFISFCSESALGFIISTIVSSERAMATHSSTLAWKIPWTEEPARLQSMGSLRVGHDWATSLSLFLSCIGEGNGNPLQCSCLENPRDGGAWWAAAAQSWTRLKQLNSSSSYCFFVFYFTNLRFLRIALHLLWSGSFSWVYNSAMAFKTINTPVITTFDAPCVFLCILFSWSFSYRLIF